MVQYNPLQRLPTSAELPDSDDTPVDNELQDLIPHLLKAILSLIWQERTDWFFGVDMGVYHTTGNNPRIPIVPDGFLSIGVERRKSERGRLSYVLWEENEVVPLMVLEVVSQNYGGEYDDKQAKYARLGVLYYVIYNPDHWTRDRHEPLEVYRLDSGNYVPQVGEQVWMPEIGLGIGRSQGTYQGWTREWLYWYDSEGNRLLTPEEIAHREQERAERLATRLREMGIDPDNL
ncbi:MAG TPA: Uma2 family endonuclease [Candidatus Obscuribacterales bacterium]